MLVLLHHSSIEISVMLTCIYFVRYPEWVGVIVDVLSAFLVGFDLSHMITGAMIALVYE